MLRFGKISDIDVSGGRAKVSFAEDKIVSDWMSMIVPKTNGDSYSWTLEVNQQVACLMDVNQINGVILGSIYSKDVVPVDAGEDIVSINFDGGDSVKYNRSTGKMELTASGGVTINGDLLVEGQVDVTGAVDAGGDVTAGLLNTSLTTHTHQVPGIQSGTSIATSNPPT